jgi:hypothetical protein
MGRFFNTAGPCKPDIHYMLPPLDRLPGVERIIDRQGYFVIHAPRQTGKTTAMMALAKELTASGRYVSVLVSMEVGAPFSDDPGAAELVILGVWRDTAAARLPDDLQPPLWPSGEPGGRIRRALSAWANAAPRPLALFLDEIDALQDQALISVLRQLRDGYADRPRAFPWSLALIDLRDVRDYKVASGGSERLNTASPFNIKVESLTLRAFTAKEVTDLYQQHTDDTGQVFAPEALTRAFELTQGQPWLVNALARQVVEVIVPDPAQPITVAHIEQAKNILIARQDTHLDSLVEKLRHPRVRQVIEPMLAGRSLGDVPSDDRQHVIDLGLARRDPAGGLVIANPIYREVIPRVLAGGPQDSLPHIQPTWLQPDGRLDVDRLLQALFVFLAAARTAVAGQRAVSRDRAPPGADGVPPPRRQRGRDTGTRIRHRQRADGYLPAIRPRHGGDGAQGLARRRARPVERGLEAVGALLERTGARDRLAGDL